MKKDRKVQHHMNPYRVLVAEDDYEMRKLLAGTLNDSGYDVVECPDGMAMLTHLAAFLLPDEFAQEKIDLIISDVRMPGISGMEVLEGKPRHHAFPPMILITAFGDDQTHAMAAQFGAAAMLDKPFDMDDLLGKMTEILH